MKIVIADIASFDSERQRYVIAMLVESNNELEERLSKLEPQQQELTLEIGCECKEPWTALGNLDCLRCGKRNRVQVVR